MMSGSSRRKSSRPNNSFSVDDMEEEEEESEGVGVKDVKQILPTCLILLITLVITVTVIPYAFSSVIKCDIFSPKISFPPAVCSLQYLTVMFRQMQAADRMEEWRAAQQAADQLSSLAPPTS